MLLFIILSTDIVNLSQNASIFSIEEIELLDTGESKNKKAEFEKLDFDKYMDFIFTALRNGIQSKNNNHFYGATIHLDHCLDIITPPPEY